ncbi:hypothetical protein [Nocardioides aequoreus]|uniref:hypothetical protein n=1 Tax=Nocardioides aequoreus TaxID=397278 RepID=UPI0004C311A4|nr:hypothetical protein [Nocardioides aequoreus]
MRRVVEEGAQADPGWSRKARSACLETQLDAQVRGVSTGSTDGAAGRVSQDNLLPHRGWWVVAVDRGVRGEVDDGSDPHDGALEAAAAEPAGEEVGRQRAEPLDDRHAVSLEVRRREVDVQVDDAGSTGLGIARCSGHQVQRVLRVREDADGLGAADVEGVGVTQLLELAGQSSDGVVEGDRVGGVERQVNVRDPGCAAVALQPHPTTRGRGFFVGVGAVGVGVEPGLVHQPRGAHGTELVETVRDGAEQPVGVQRGVQGQVAGLPRDRPGAPHRDPAGAHQLPQPRQPARRARRGPGARGGRGWAPWTDSMPCH